MNHPEALHPFDAAIRLDSAESGRYRGRIHQGYANFVGPFGGAIAATLLNAAWSHPDRRGGPIALTVNFAAPIADEAFEVAARAVRTSRSTQHWSMELSQHGAIACTATAIFATRRSTWSAVEATRPSATPASELPLLDSATYPAWVSNYEMRVVEGDITFGAAPRQDSVSTLWIRDKQPRPLDFLALASMSDTFFPRLFVRRQAFSPIGTVSMTTFFHADSSILARQGTAELLATARAQRFHNGYFDQSAELQSCGAVKANCW